MAASFGLTHKARPETRLRNQSRFVGAAFLLYNLCMILSKLYAAFDEINIVCIFGKEREFFHKLSLAAILKQALHFFHHLLTCI